MHCHHCTCMPVLFVQGPKLTRRTLHPSLFKYPLGSPRCVEIRERDLRCLQPGKFLNDSIIDFGLRCVPVAFPFMTFTFLNNSTKKQAQRFPILGCSFGGGDKTWPGHSHGGRV